MLVKPSEKTTALVRRGNWLFLAFWLAVTGYILLSAAGMTSRSLDKAFFSAAGIVFIVNFAHAILGLLSARQDSKKSQHPDPDVAALVDGKIDITEYRERKEQREREL
ncbi:hypothetical protein [Pelomonas sp. KK5]|uniref:hypothetical protein n=1 Tax=Pelomonas sp. KK5 TaxID=1855730 RepID=UPI00097CA3FC|nr:hypothetical protein [Pelomonas sp. KK5]